MIRCILGFFADILVFLNKRLGLIYTFLFGIVGTSWYDHRFDYLRGVENYFWLERAFYTLNKITSDSILLDLGCGDGVYSGVFYSSKAKRIVAVDKDKSAIEHAQKYYGKKNVNFICKDIEKWDFPEIKFDLILMFAVIEHFEASKGLVVLEKIGRSLKKGGVFFGSTPIFTKKGKISNFEHQNEFISEESLKAFLLKRFNKVKIYNSNWPNRNECYFECQNPK